MGLAASNARMLMLTARKSDVEGDQMSICNQKLSLSRQAAGLSSAYTDALNQSMLVWNTDSSNSEQLTYDNLMSNGYILTDLYGRTVLNDEWSSILGSDTGSAGDLSSMMDEEEFLVAMGLDEESAAAAIEAEESGGSTDEAASDEYYNLDICSASREITKDDIFKTLNGGYTYTCQTQDGDNTHHYSSSPDESNVVEVGTVEMYGWDAEVSDAKDLVEDYVRDICTDTGAAIKDLFGASSFAGNSEVESAFDDAIEYATIETVAYYRSDVADENETENSWHSGRSGAQEDAEGSSHIQVDADCGDDEIYVDTTEVVKKFISYWRDACYSIADDGETDTSFDRSGSAGDEMRAASDAAIAAGGADSSEEEDSTDTSAEYYLDLYEQINSSGWTINENIDDPEYLENQLLCGGMYMNQWTGDGFSTISLSDSDSPISSVSDEDAIAQAEAEYEAAKDELDYKESLLDVEMNNLDTERAAIDTEMDSVQKIIDDNIEVFKMFDA